MCWHCTTFGLKPVCHGGVGEWLCWSVATGTGLEWDTGVVCLCKAPRRSSWASSWDTRTPLKGPRCLARELRFRVASFLAGLTGAGTDVASTGVAGTGTVGTEVAGTGIAGSEAAGIGTACTVGGGTTAGGVALVVVMVVVVTTAAPGSVRHGLCEGRPVASSPGDQGSDGAAGSKLKVLSRARGQSRPHLHTPSVCR
uniref:Uncharacterized protein n=1 Tax=Ixodes ricinus TaxID=34613 RepID=A0A6B0V0R8_IXORI